MNSHLVIPEVRPVGAYTSMCELHPLVGKSVRYGCAFGGSNRFVETKRVGFYRFPALAGGRRWKGSRQSSKINGLHHNIREYAVVFGSTVIFDLRE